MSQLTSELNNLRQHETINFNGGTSYTLDPLMTLKIVCASSIFGENQFYRSNHKSRCSINYMIEPYLMLSKEPSLTTQEYMNQIIDEALEYDYRATIEFACELRNLYHIRINPQIIMVRAALHPKRKQFNEQHPNLFRLYQELVMQRADEPSTQLTYYLTLNEGRKNGIPTILKKSWADKLSSLDRYQISKYKNAEIGMINTIRVSHAHSPIIDELMQTGSVEVDEEEKTWQNLRSAGKTWKEILVSDMYLPHMALLRNLRGIFSELEESEDTMNLADKLLTQLVNGVKLGKQFPYRYYIAYKAIENVEVSYKQNLLDALEKCLETSIENMPRLKGKTLILTDNSGSMSYTFNSEYGSVTFREIANLSAVLTALNSDEATISIFGSTIRNIDVKKTDSILETLEKINQIGERVGQGTCNALVHELIQSCKKEIKWDNIFIYSDMQICSEYVFFGKDELEFCKQITSNNPQRALTTLDIVDYYRKNIHDKVNIFSVMIAGYNNSLLPDYLYRGCLLTGWTGKEVLFANRMIELWNELDQTTEHSRSKIKN